MTSRLKHCGGWPASPAASSCSRTCRSLAWFLDDIDAINFAMGVREFDIAKHQPHPPGYPVFIAAGQDRARCSWGCCRAPVGLRRDRWKRARWRCGASSAARCPRCRSPCCSLQVEDESQRARSAAMVLTLDLSAVLVHQRAGRSATCRASRRCWCRRRWRPRRSRGSAGGARGRVKTATGIIAAANGGVGPLDRARRVDRRPGDRRALADVLADAAGPRRRHRRSRGTRRGGRAARRGPVVQHWRPAVVRPDDRRERADRRATCARCRSRPATDFSGVDMLVTSPQPVRRLMLNLLQTFVSPWVSLPLAAVDSGVRGDRLPGDAARLAPRPDPARRDDRALRAVPSRVPGERDGPLRAAARAGGGRIWRCAASTACCAAPCRSAPRRWWRRAR